MYYAYMSRRHAAAVLLGFILVAVGCVAPEEGDEGAFVESPLAGSYPVGTELRTTAAVNLRREPSTSAAILETLAEGTFVKSASARPRGEWYGVTTAFGTGWVHGDYLERAGAVSSGELSARARDQMDRILRYAEQHNQGASRGRCFEFVWRYLTASGYGTIDSFDDAPDMPSAYARNFAEYMNVGGNAERWGLRRLGISNPYDAPRGAVVVVAPGTPGTSHPTAGDITIAAGAGRFINDGPNMSYGGSREAFSRGGGRVLGIYVPR